MGAGSCLLPVVYVGDGIDCVFAAVSEPFVYDGGDHFAMIPREALRSETTSQVRRREGRC